MTSSVTKKVEIAKVVVAQWEHARLVSERSRVRIPDGCTACNRSEVVLQEDDPSTRKRVLTFCELVLPAYIVLFELLLQATIDPGSRNEWIWDHIGDDHK